MGKTYISQRGRELMDKHYMILYSKGHIHNPVYKTLEEARAVCKEIYQKTRYIMCIQETEREVTHEHVL